MADEKTVECGTCSRKHDGSWEPHHPWTPPDEENVPVEERRRGGPSRDSRAAESPASPPRRAPVNLPKDPVLRGLLVSRGVISVEELDQWERMVGDGNVAGQLGMVRVDPSGEGDDHSGSSPTDR